jgi:hypothetical protein
MIILSVRRFQFWLHFIFTIVIGVIKIYPMPINDNLRYFHFTNNLCNFRKNGIEAMLILIELLFNYSRVDINILYVLHISCLRFYRTNSYY